MRDKFLRFLAILMFAGFVSLGLIILSTGGPRQKYSGKITELYRVPVYKGGSDCHVVFYSDSLKRKVDVIVRDNEYVNLKVNDTFSKRLFPVDLER
jgi:hypothetical protein